MVTTPGPITPEQASRLLLAIQAIDAVACAIPLPAIQQDLERLGCPPWLQRTIPVVKGASVVGLIVGRNSPRLARLTTGALVGYFLCAMGAHGRVRDPAWRWAPAAGMLGLTLLARRSFAEPEVIDLTAEAGIIDLTEPEPAQVPSTEGEVGVEVGQPVSPAAAD